MSDFPRDPEHYEMSVHALQQHKDRNIPLEAVAECIENGEKRDSNGHSGIKVAAKWGAVEYWAALAPEDGEVKSCGVVG